jgi:hypothetical protein
MTEDELAQAQIDLDRWAASQAAGYTPSEKAAMQAFIAKNAKKWALPTTGNLAYDDYRRSSEAFGKAARGAITGYTPTVTTGEGTEYYQEIAGSPIYGASVGNPDLYFQDWLGSMSPQQQAEYESLQDAHHDKITSRMQLAALAAFGGIAGAGMFGAGMLGSGGAFGGAAGGLEGMAAAAAPGYASGLTAAEAAGIAEMMGGAGALGGAGGIGTLGALEALPAGFGTVAEGGFAAIPEIGIGSLGALGAMPAGLGSVAEGGFAAIPEITAGAAGGGSLLQQLQNAIKTGGPDVLKSLGGNVNWLSLLGNLGSSWLGSNAAKNASEAQLQAGREANALAKYIYDTSRADQAPYRDAGFSALAGIQGLLADPSSVAQMPDYQFGFDQGSKALQNSATARGMTYSGQQGKALQKYGNDYANSKLNESYNRLASIAGIGQQATNQTGVLGANYANTVGNTMQNMGNAQGAGTIGSANAWGQGIGNILNDYQGQSYLDAWLKSQAGGN